MNVLIVNYNSGNLASLYNAFLKASKDRKKKINLYISNNPKLVESSDKIILPGVGDFSNCKNQLASIDGMQEALNDFVYQKKKPFLGICIGMQLMAEKSFERIESLGLGYFESQVKKISVKNKSIKIPHMGWNEIRLVNSDYKKSFNSLLTGDFYFVHSYEMICKNKNDIIATVNYGKEIVAAVCKENIIGVQFHPEKSQEHGQKLINNFLDWNP
ncbi:MAG: imidazole glycerol phosphate synthase subunit HisH [Pelagibacterales bacterium]|nr:imidazole glycerol phosphate synthase subunit HisH [Pelagibacterales bacterium]|tara:strand:- start:123 stop:767 length:645 start_codon:yes stop_codon:yes gene_type:complete